MKKIITMSNKRCYLDTAAFTDVGLGESQQYIVEHQFKAK